MIKAKNKVGRNQLCTCGSGLKFKFCHGDEIKQMVCNRVANEYMVYLIELEKKKRGLVPYNYTCNDCNNSFDEPSETATVPHLPTCPKCSSVNIKERG